MSTVISCLSPLSMRHRDLGVTLMLGLACLAQPTTAQPVADQETLLLVQLDGSAEADFARGQSVGLASGAFVPGRFGQALDLREGARLRFVGNDGNFHPDQGTIDFWIKPHWPGDDEQKHSFFNCRFGARGYINVNTLGKGRLGIAVSSGDGDDWRWRRADGDTSSWQAEQWHHVAFAWGEGKLHVYLDGQESTRRAVDDARMPDALPEELLFSAADVAIDAIRISRRCFTADDAARAFQAAQGPPPYRYLKDVLPESMSRCALGGRVLLGGIRIPHVLGTNSYRNSLGCRPGAQVKIALEGQYQSFAAVVGVDASSPPKAACLFEVWGDGRKLAQVGPLTVAQEPQPIEVGLAGVRELSLRTNSSGKANSQALGVWASGVLARGDAAPVMVPPRQLKPAEVDMYQRQQSADDFTFTSASQAPLLVAGKFWEDELDPAQPPAADRLGATLKALATPGEYEPINCVVYALQDLEQVAVEISDLRAGNAILPSECVDVRLVLRGLMRDIYVLPPERSTVVSRFLLPYETIDMPAGTMREYHLTVHVPENAAAGQYTGHVRVAPAGREAIQVPVQFEVLPFRFRPLQRKAYGVYYRFPQAVEDWQGLDVELADIRAHGGTMLTANLGVSYELAEDKAQASFAEIERGLTLLKQHGFHGSLPIHTNLQHLARLLKYDVVKDHDKAAARQRFLGAAKQAMQQLAEMDKRYPAFELLPTHMDEVFGRDRLERYIRLTEAVRQVPDLRVYITLHNSPRRGAAEAMLRCDPFVDVRCYNGHVMDEWIRAGNSFAKLADELKQSGDEAWTYYNIRGSFFRAEWTRLVNGFYLWISPLRVHVPWMYYSFQGNPFDDTDGPRLRGHDFAYAVPDPADRTRMVPTRHWEAFREGIDDMRYLCTLEDLVAEHAGSPQAQAAQAWLDQLRNRVTPKLQELEPIEDESPILILLSERFNGPDYRQFRRQAAEHIVKLLAMSEK